METLVNRLAGFVSSNGKHSDFIFHVDFGRCCCCCDQGGHAMEHGTLCDGFRRVMDFAMLNPCEEFTVRVTENGRV
jgi:hypothetical protein